MDDLEDMFEKGEGSGINFIPCVKWVQRGVAKSEPEKVRTQKIKVHNFLGLKYGFCKTKKSLLYE